MMLVEESKSKLSPSSSSSGVPEKGWTVRGTTEGPKQSEVYLCGGSHAADSNPDKSAEM